MMIKKTYYKFKSITLPHSNFLFYHMLVNSFVHTNLMSIIKKMAH
jgi:hypothetical protein